MNELTLDQIRILKCTILDLRSAETFARGHIEGSVNVPFGSSFVQWAQAVALPDESLVLVVPEKTTAEHAAEQLRLGRFSQVLGFILESTLDSLPKKSLLKTIDPIDLSKGDRYIIDVRTPEEWNAGHIPGAHFIELSKFAKEIHTIPRDKEICLICGGGNRSSVAASFLQKSGHPHVANVRGGMAAWKRLANNSTFLL